MAHFALSSPDVAVRLDAVRDMLRSLDEATVALLRERVGVETNSRRQEGNRHGPGARRAGRLGRQGASRRDRDARATASARMCGTGWRACSRNLPTAASSKATRRCGRRPPARCKPSTSGARFYSGIETLFFGLSLGSVLVLIAIGLAITFGVMGVINMAHGELMMLGAYTTYVVQMAMPGHIGISILVAIPAAFIVAGADGRPDGAHDHPLSLRKTAGDAARDVRREPRPAATRSGRFFRRSTDRW